MGMASIAYHAPSRPHPIHVSAHLGRRAATAAVAFALLVAGLALGLSLHGSSVPRTHSLAPAQTAPDPAVPTGREQTP